MVRLPHSRALGVAATALPRWLWGLLGGLLRGLLRGLLGGLLWGLLKGLLCGQLLAAIAAHCSLLPLLLLTQLLLALLLLTLLALLLLTVALSCLPYRRLLALGRRLACRRRSRKLSRWLCGRLCRWLACQQPGELLRVGGPASAGAAGPLVAPCPSWRPPQTRRLWEQLPQQLNAGLHRRRLLGSCCWWRRQLSSRL